MTIHRGSRHERNTPDSQPRPLNGSTAAHVVFPASHASVRRSAHGMLLERRLPGGLDEVWNFLTSVDQLGLLLTGRGEGEAARRRRGEILRAQPPRLLSFVWPDTMLSAGGPRCRNLLITVELTAEGDTVRLVLTIEPDAPPAGDQAQPWPWS